jgi:hypothetical protein
MGQVTEGEDRRVHALVLRATEEETTFALVRCTRTPEVQTSAQLFARVRAAVTTWARSTAAGRAACDDSDGDYNVGDLAHDLGDRDLRRLLEQHGVLELDVDVYSYEEPLADWDFDDYLVQPGDGAVSPEAKPCGPRRWP